MRSRRNAVVVFAGAPMPRCARAALAIDPPGIAVPIMLLLPDRQPVFDLIDDVAASLERLAAVLGADADPDRHIADREDADPVHAQRVLDGVALQRFAHDRLAFLDRKIQRTPRIRAGSRLGLRYDP